MVYRSKESTIRNRRQNRFNSSYSAEPRDMDMDVKGYGFLYFAENMSKNLSNK